ncbi:hypothetical protein BS17DRAFT_765168 [Gyrodon lividus]|nr:hypothetical protein BS17DRAFT_765168 [Gyrodon lividus]
MLPYSSTFTKENDIHHQFLSKQQGTHFAVLPIHSHVECLLFQAYAEFSPHFTSPAKPDFAILAHQMNEHTDGQQFFYKLSEHLRTYYITWKDIANEKTSTTLSNDALRQNCSLLKSQVGSPHSIPTAAPQSLTATVGPASISQGPSQPNFKWQLNQLLANHCLKCSALHYHYRDQAQPERTLSTSSAAHPGQKHNAKTSVDLDWPLKKSHTARSCTYC